MGKINRFKIIIPVYNSEKWIAKCIDSIKVQTYGNFVAVIINDCSTDNTKKIIEKEIINDNRFFFIDNKTKTCALENTIKGIDLICNDKEDIIVIVDGDDCLASDDVLEYLNKVYQENIWTTWGQFKLLSNNKVCWYAPKKETWCVDLKGKFIRRKMGRFIFSHLRTYKHFLFRKIKVKDLKDSEDRYYTTAGDVLVSLPIIEMAGKKHRKFISKIMYCYNDLNQLSDMRRCPKLQMGIFENLKHQKQYKEI